MVRFRWVMAVALVLCAVPMISALAASGIASAWKCRLHEGFATPCVVLGFDIGGALYTMLVLGWLMLATMPVAVLLAAGWMAVEIVRIVRARA